MVVVILVGNFAWRFSVFQILILIGCIYKAVDQAELDCWCQYIVVVNQK